jgi:MYXO-CTERM domain-containing protein
MRTNPRKKPAIKYLWQAGLAVVILAACVHWPAPAKGENGDTLTVVDSQAFSGRLQPCDELVMVVGTGNVDILTLPTSPLLTEKAELAVEQAPSWLRDRLSHRLGYFANPTQDALADLILLAADPNHMDEIAFTVATVPPEEIERDGFDPSILALNARLVYEAVGHLPYVELVEVGRAGTDDDYHTTARYAVTDHEGQMTWVELPREAYYWYVVHPRLSSEPLLFVDPVTGDPAPRTEGGVFWRAYFLYQDTEPGARASLHFITEHPHMITDQDLSDWGLQTQVVLADFEVDPIPLIVDAQGRGPVLVDMAYPGRTYDGVVLATTLPAEQAHEAGHPEFLENLILAGNASAHIPPRSRVAVIKDRDPWGTPTVENVLGGLGFDWDVYRSADLASLDATALSQYKKIVVPSAQSRAFYEQLAAHHELIRDFLSMNPDSRDVVFQFHGATDDATPQDNWHGLVMPGGFAGIAVQGGAVEQLTVAGYPTLLDVMAGTEIYWDATPQRLSGNDPLPPDAQALIRLGYFGTQNTPDRCSEMPTYYHGPDGEHSCLGSCSSLVQALRSGYPQRILYLHYGNCGEMQAVLGAAARTALVPVADVDARADDHVWNEFFHEDRWVNYSIYRSDAAAVVDYQGLIHDGWAAVMALRGDGYAENATPRYTPTVTLDIQVTDADGRPVDGATLMVASEYNKQVGETVPLTPLMLAWADRDGRAAIDLGLNRNYYVQVASALGYIPGPDDRYVGQVTCETQAPQCPGTDEEGRVIELTLAYETVAEPAPFAESVEPDQQPADYERKVTISVAADRQILESINPLQLDTFEKHLGTGEADVTVLDATGFADYTARRPYAAVAEHLQVNAAELELPAPSGRGDLYVVVANRRRIGLSQQIQATVTLLAPPDPPNQNDTSSSGGCGCRTAAPGTHRGLPLPLLPALALLLLVLLFARRRSRAVHRP